jgi:hypothetical protein
MYPVLPLILQPPSVPFTEPSGKLTLFVFIRVHSWFRLFPAYLRLFSLLRPFSLAEASVRAQNRFMRNTIWLVILLGFVGCAHQEVTEQIPVAGHRSVTLKRVGNEFTKVENDRFAVVEAGLTTYRTEGKNFVRWQFTIRPRPETQLAVVEVEDLTGRRPSLLIKDEHPQIEELQWSGQSQLIRATPSSVRWLFTPDQSTRVFRVTVTEPDGKRSSLYQATRYNADAKKKFRIMMGPELQRPPEH